MLTINDLLEDSHYKEYFLKVPKLPVHPPSALPWRVFLLLKQNDGSPPKWGSKDFHTYKEAFLFFKRKRATGNVMDGAINCRSASFGPPMRWAKIKGKFVKGQQAMKQIAWQPVLDPNDTHEYMWCPWCRRPTAFQYYGKHRALRFSSGLQVDPSVRRCHICGASERIANFGKASSTASVQTAARRKGKK